MPLRLLSEPSLTCSPETSFFFIHIFQFISDSEICLWKNQWKNNKTDTVEVIYVLDVFIAQLTQCLRFFNEELVQANTIAGIRIV